MRECKECGSQAINPRSDGREPDVDLDLCDVCYWRKRAETYEAFIKKAREESSVVIEYGQKFSLVPYWFMKD